MLSGQLPTVLAAGAAAAGACGAGIQGGLAACTATAARRSMTQHSTAHGMM